MAQDKHRPQRGGKKHPCFDTLSTGLKILSRITKPTQGRAEVDGRVGSLLEVGIGFHPELTARENIYLNGAILGMRKTETCPERRRMPEEDGGCGKGRAGTTGRRRR